MRKRKPKKIENYIEDRELTTLLMKEINKLPKEVLGKRERGAKPPSPSEELSNAYLEIMYNILRKPNFSGYYEEVRESIISRCQIVFLLNWYKFKPYRVRNNFKIESKGKYVSRPLEKGTNVMYTTIPLKKYDLLSINNRTFTIMSCEESENSDGVKDYKITMFNKLKNEIKMDTNVVKMYPKTDFEDPEPGELNGAFSFFSLFVFTAAKNEITSFKKRKEKTKEYLELKESSAFINSGQYVNEEI